MVAGMARANRLRGDGGVFHLTHRCHNRAFLLKFARDRDAYRAKAQELLRQFDVSVARALQDASHLPMPAQKDPPAQQPSSQAASAFSLPRPPPISFRISCSLANLLSNDSNEPS